MSFPTPGAFKAIYRLVLKHQLTRGRIALFAVVAAIAIGLAFLARQGIDNAEDRIEAAAIFVDNFGLGLAAPVISLVLGSAAFGNWKEDETLVYVWLRPVSRWVIGLAATAAALTVTLPTTVIPLTIATWIGTKGDLGMTGAAATSMTLATVAYTALFVLLGLVIKRALVWGLVYVFIWEFFVARIGAGAARLSINSYAKAILARESEVDIGFAEHSTVTTFVVPLAVAAVAVWLTTQMLNRANVA